MKNGEEAYFAAWLLFRLSDFFKSHFSRSATLFFSSEMKSLTTERSAAGSTELISSKVHHMSFESNAQQ